MAQVSTATTNFDKTVQVLIQKKLEERLRAPLPHLLPGSFLPANYVKGSNGTMRFINIPDLGVTTGTPTPGVAPWLTEGVPPTAEDLVIGYEEFTAAQAGRVIKITDVAMMESPFDLIDQASDLVARNVLAFADQRVGDVIAAGANKIYSDASAPQVNDSSDDVRPTDVLTSNDIRRAVAFLRNTNIPSFGDGFYRGIISPFATFDVEGDGTAGGWIDAQRYATPENMLSGEIGRYGGVRFFQSSVAGAGVDAGTGTVFAGTTTGDTTGGAAEDLFTTSVAHGLVAGDRVRFITRTGGTLPTVGTKYYVIAANLAATTFQLSATAGGAAIEIGGSDITVSTWAKVINTAITTIHGPGAWAFGNYGSMETHFTPPGGHDDPLHQSALIGWKAFIGAMLVGEGTGATNVSLPRYINIISAESLRGG